MYQVTDNNKLKEQLSVGTNMPEVFELFLIWESRIYLYTLRILLSVHLRVTVFLRYLHGIHVYDGPGMDSDQINNSSVMYLSSFQAFVVVFTNIMSDKYEMYQFEFGLIYAGRYIGATEVHIDNSETLKSSIMHSSKIHKYRNM